MLARCPGELARPLALQVCPRPRWQLLLRTSRQETVLINAKSDGHLVYVCDDVGIHTAIAVAEIIKEALMAVLSLSCLRGGS